MGKVMMLSVEDTKKVIGGSAWSKLGQVVGGLATGAAGGAGLGTAICGPACGLLVDCMVL